MRPTVVLALCLGWSCIASTQSAAGAQGQRDVRLLTAHDLFESADSQLIVSVDLDTQDDHGSPSGARLAILDRDALHIYKQVAPGKFAAEFALNQPPIPWDHMQSFPSIRQLFGVVLWGSEEESYNPATVVCFVNGEFKVVFRSNDVSFADLNFDGVPEILVTHYPSATAKQPSDITVWAWNGKEYLSVANVKQGELSSAKVLDAVQHVKR